LLATIEDPTALDRIAAVFWLVKDSKAGRDAASPPDPPMGHPCTHPCHPGRGDLGDLLHLRREHSISNQEHVRAETGTLMPSPDLSHDAGSHHRPDTGNSPDSDHHVVELEIGILGKGHAELERGRILGADDAAYETHWISLLTRARLL